MVSTASRVSYTGVEGAEDLLTPEFLDYVVEAYDKFADRVQEVREKREALLRKALDEGVMPTSCPILRLVTTGRCRRFRTNCGSPA